MWNSTFFTFSCLLVAFQSLHEQKRRLYKVDKFFIVCGHYSKNFCPLYFRIHPEPSADSFESADLGWETLRQGPEDTSAPPKKTNVVELRRSVFLRRQLRLQSTDLITWRICNLIRAKQSAPEACEKIIQQLTHLEIVQWFSCQLLHNQLRLPDNKITTFSLKASTWLKSPMDWQSTLHPASVTVQCKPLFTHKVDCKAMSKVSGLSQRKITRIED